MAGNCNTNNLIAEYVYGVEQNANCLFWYLLVFEQTGNEGQETIFLHKFVHYYELHKYLRVCVQGLCAYLKCVLSMATLINIIYVYIQ